MIEHVSWLAQLTLRSARKIVVGLIGGTILIVGLILLVTPGPAFVVIPIGLAILALEFAWARHWLQRLTGRAGQPAADLPPKSDDASPRVTP